MLSTIEIGNELKLSEVVLFAKKARNWKISDKKLQGLLLSNPDYPKLSSVSSVLRELSIQNKALRITQSQLQELQPHFFAHLLGHGIVYIFNILDDKIHYYTANKEEVIVESMVEFNQKWTGIVLLMDDQSVSIDSSWNTENKKKKFGWLEFGLVSLLCLLLLFFKGIESIKLFDLFSLSLKCSGVFLSWQLVNMSLKKEQKKYCQIGTNIDCSEVLTSKAAKLFGKISLSEIGLIYFSSNLLFWIYGMINNDRESIHIILQYAAVSCLPYAFYSLYYQGIKLKKWCIYCLAVVSVLIVDASMQVYFHVDSISSLSIYYFFLFLLYLWGVSFIWRKFKIHQLNTIEFEKINYPYQRIVNNRSVFESLHEDEREILAPSTNECLRIGNENARNQLVVVLSLNCSECGKQFKNIYQLWKNKKDEMLLSLLIIGDLSSSKSVKSMEAINTIQHYSNQSENDFMKDLNTYFDSSKNNPFDSLRMTINAQSIELFHQQQKWIVSNNIRQSPLLLFNGKKLNNLYSANQLHYFF